MTWDAILILRPDLSPLERLAVVTKLVAAIESDMRKGADGGGTIFTAELKRRDT